jgi:lysophospholipase L1-like esterase
MGSSFAAGPGLGQAKPGTPERCARSSLNYPTLLAAELGLVLRDVSCSGATTAHVLGAWDELPPQIEAVTPETRLVTVTIGGNDVAYVGNLFAASRCGEGACEGWREPTEQDWARDEANMRAIARQVRERAPDARLVFVDYLSLLPAVGSCATTPLAPERAAILRGVAARLRELTARVAREEGTDLLSAATLSEAHTPCDPEPWSAGAPGTAEGAPWHPNAAGMRAVADALAERLAR